MLTPATQNMTVYRGGTFERIIELWEDSAHTKRFNLTGYTVELVVEGVLTLTEGKGLTVTAAEGKIEVEMTPEQTALVAANISRHFYLQLTKSGKVTFPLDGEMEYQQP